MSLRAVRAAFHFFEILYPSNTVGREPSMDLLHVAAGLLVVDAKLNELAGGMTRKSK